MSSFGRYKRTLPVLVLFTILLIPVYMLAGCGNQENVSEEETVELFPEVTAAESSCSITFSHPSGFYDEPFQLTITASDGNTVYYTLDGSIPTPESAVYEAPIEITDASSNENVYSMRTDVSLYFETGRYSAPEITVDKCTILRAAVFDDAGDLLQESFGSYFVGFQDKIGYDRMNVVSLITAPENLFDYETGIYVLGKAYDEAVAAGVEPEQGERFFPANYREKGKEWEREAYVCFFDPDHHLMAEQPAGIRIKGRGTRICIPKSFNLYAREDYGAKTFGADPVQVGYLPKHIALYSGGMDRSKIKNVLAAELTADLDFANLSYQPCVVFLDGEYWGVYWITDKFDGMYFQENFGMDKDDVVMIKGGEVEIGEDDDISLYEELLDFCVSNDLSDPVLYGEFQERVDMESFLDYYATELYLANHDWPAANFALWRSRKGGGEGFCDGRWRWMFFDTDEECMEQWYSYYDSVEAARNSDVMFDALCENAEFRQAFADRLLLFSGTIFAPENVAPVLNKYVDLMLVPVEVEGDRYHFDEDEIVWERGEYMRGFFEQRPQAMKEIIMAEFPDVSIE